MNNADKFIELVTQFVTELLNRTMTTQELQNELCELRTLACAIIQVIDVYNDDFRYSIEYDIFESYIENRLWTINQLPALLAELLAEPYGHGRTVHISHGTYCYCGRHFEAGAA